MAVCNEKLEKILNELEKRTIRMEKPLKIYVAGNYSADNTIETLQNIGKGEEICAELFKEGFAPFCPWHDKTYATSLPYTYLPVEHFRAVSMVWLEVSEAMLVISGKGEGGGVDAEIVRAKEFGVLIFESMNALLDWRIKSKTNRK